MSKRKCARGSMRIVKRGDVLIRVCCPKGKGHWKRKRCKVGMRAQATARRR